MKRILVLALAYFLISGCPQQGPPTSTTTPMPPKTPAAEATATPSPEASPEETATPVSTDISTRQGISALQKLLDKQVEDKVLTSTEVKDGDATLTVWKGEQGIRRIDVVLEGSDGNKETAKYYYQNDKVFSMGGEGTRKVDDKDESYTFWAGISGEDALVGPPFQFVGGKSGSFPEEQVRERQAKAMEYHGKASE